MSPNPLHHPPILSPQDGQTQDDTHPRLSYCEWAQDLETPPQYPIFSLIRFRAQDKSSQDKSICKITSGPGQIIGKVDAYTYKVLDYFVSNSGH